MEKETLIWRECTTMKSEAEARMKFRDWRKEEEEEIEKTLNLKRMHHGEIWSKKEPDPKKQTLEKIWELRRKKEEEGVAEAQLEKKKKKNWNPKDHLLTC
jgi:hypothetical protein